MGTNQEPAMGTLVGFDLTVDDAETLRDFYTAVVGWDAEPADQGGYFDYFMKTPGTGQIVAGVCHARGDNADLPPQWLAYFAVADLEASMRRCTESGGTLVTGVKGVEGSRYCVVRDPAGATISLMHLGEE